MQIAVLCAAILSSTALFAADSIPAAEAKNHIGETATVCGKVVGARYLESSEKRPTFLNFDQPYPNHTFTTVIFGADREKFGKPEETYRDKAVCVSGKIEEYSKKPQIVVTDPKQILLDSK